MRLFRRTDVHGHATGPWIALYYDATGQRIQRTTKQHDYRAAEMAAREFERESADPARATPRGAPRGATLATALALLVRTRAEQARVGVRSAATLQMYEQKVEQLRRGLGAETPLKWLDAARVDAYVTARRAVVSDHTVAKEIIALRSALKLARRQGLYSGDLSLLPIGLGSGYKPRTRALTEPEVYELLKVLPPDKSARVAFIVATGARWGETMRARRADIGQDRVWLWGTKTDLAPRAVPILSTTLYLLEYARENSEGRNGALFRPWPNNVHRDLDRACALAQITPGCTPNDLRRTFATRLRSQGVPVELLAPVMGHVDSRMVERVYGRMSNEVLHSRIESALESNCPKTQDRKKQHRSNTATTRQDTIARTGNLGSASK